MFLEKKDGMGKKNSRNAVIGYDLSDAYAQITYCFKNSEEPETFSIVAGTEQYNIPAVLCKRNEVNQWFYGKEALRYAQEGDGIKVENLVENARKGQLVDVGEDSFDPIALLTLFIKRSLSAMSLVLTTDCVDGVMFTLDNLDKRMIEVLTQVAANLNLKTSRIFFQSHEESFYQYMLYQEEKLWTYEVLLCDYDNSTMKIYELNSNRKTTPVVVFIDTDQYMEMESKNVLQQERETTEKVRLDQCFLDILKRKCGGKAISSVYLIGEGYKDEWLSESLHYLCQGRRVFRGNNLYSKGACYSIREKLGLSNAGENYVFLGADKLRANIGMRVLRNGIDSYFAVMDAGENWYDAKKEYEVILESGDSISIILTPLNGKDVKEINMILDGLPERPEGTTRLHIMMEMLSENQISVKVKDRGFGELFAASGGEWVKLFEL